MERGHSWRERRYAANAPARVNPQFPRPGGGRVERPPGWRGRAGAGALAPAPENTKAPPVSGKGLSPRFTRSGYLATGSFSSFQAVIPPRIDATFVNPIAASSNAALPERPPERHTRTMGVSRDQSRAT